MQENECLLCRKQSPGYTKPRKKPVKSERTKELERRNRRWLVMSYAGMTIAEIAHEEGTYPQKVRVVIKREMV